jgi:hypothetical protein
MNDKQKEPKLTYALNEAGKMVSIDSVEKGLSCKCRCPKCKEFLIAKQGHGVRKPHFAHQGDNNCHGAYMSALHKLAEQIIEEEKAVMAPAYKEMKAQKLSFVETEVERRVDRNDVQPDVVGVTDDGLRWHIEIHYTSEVDESKKAKLLESSLTCLEIDVRKQKLDEDQLKSFLLNSIEERKWIYNPNYELLIAKAKQKRISHIVSLLGDIQGFLLPPYAHDEVKKIYVTDVIVLSETEDGQYAQVKAKTSDGNTYIFHIGSKETLDKFRTTLGQIKEYNELKIYTDKLPLDTIIHSHNLDIKWFYHYNSGKEQEAEIRKYQANPSYEVLPRRFCNSQCKYTPINGKCIYLVKTIIYQQINLIVCNKKKQLKEETESTSLLGNNTPVNTKTPCKVNDYRYWRMTKTDYMDSPSISSIHVESELLPDDDLSNDSLPFDKYWTIDDYFKHLQSTSSFEYEKNHWIDVVKCDRISNGILILCKEPSEVRIYCPYQIVIASVNKGEIKHKKVSVYTNESAALKAYYERIKFDQNNANYSQTDDNNDLPF